MVVIDVGARFVCGLTALGDVLTVQRHTPLITYTLAVYWSDVSRSQKETKHQGAFAYFAFGPVCFVDRVCPAVDTIA